jgi:flagellar hook assembly protein FlgD
LRSRLESEAAGHWNVDVYDARGRNVAHLWSGFVAPGGRALAWDGRDHGGIAVPAGVYTIRAAAPQAVLTTRAVVLR